MERDFLMLTRSLHLMWLSDLELSENVLEWRNCTLSLMLSEITVEGKAICVWASAESIDRETSIERF
jgi:hypothetical protein